MESGGNGARGRASLEGKARFPLHQWGRHQDGAPSRHTNSARVPLALTPSSRQQAAVTHASFLGFMEHLSFSPAPADSWPSEFKVCTLSQSRDCCHPPAAQRHLKKDLQRPGLLCFRPRLESIWLQIQAEGKEGAKASLGQAPTVLKVSSPRCSHYHFPTRPPQNAARSG